MKNIIKKVYWAFSDWKYVLKNIPNVRQTYSGKSYYEGCPQKSVLQMYIDNLLWLIKYKELNNYYLAYGMDIMLDEKIGEYIPDSIFWKMRNRLNFEPYSGQPYNYICILRDKYLFQQYLELLQIPTPQIYAFCRGDGIRWSKSERTESVDEILSHRVDGFFKSVLGQCADAVYRIHVDGQISLNGQVISMSGFKQILKSSSFIIQEAIIQHEDMAIFHPASVNTIRLITVNSKYGILPFSSIFRMGSNGRIVDNSTVGGILVGIDIQSGKLRKWGIAKHGSKGRHTTHPSTGISFDGRIVPYFTEAVELACKLHKSLYGIHSIGWDIAITDTGPVFIEGNDNWEITGPQVCEGGLWKKINDMF